MSIVLIGEFIGSVLGTATAVSITQTLGKYRISPIVVGVVISSLAFASPFLLRKIDLPGAIGDAIDTLVHSDYFVGFVLGYGVTVGTLTILHTLMRNDKRLVEIRNLAGIDVIRLAEKEIVGIDLRALILSLLPVVGLSIAEAVL